MFKIDEKDCEILNILQVDCRASLTEIAKTVDLSIDSVNKRIKKMSENKVFWPKIQLRPRNFGFNNIVDIKIQLHYSSQNEYEQFLSYLKEHPRVSEIFSISGTWDLSIVIIAKDAIDLGNITREIRCKYGGIITSWVETLTTNSYKFEYYDMCKLLGYKRSKINFNY
jgi:DNA-binding Lrp family transcriptional regulator